MTDLVLAVDLGGTLTKVAWAGADGSVGEVVRLATQRADGMVSVPWLADLIAGRARSLASDRCLGYAVAAPGIVDAAAGVVRTAPNLGWRDVPLRDRLGASTGLAGAVSHDVRTAGLAEWRRSRPDVTDLLFVSLGTGIAGAVVVDGRLLEAGGYAGEIGHWSVAAAGTRRCACGRIGCLETVASAAAVAREFAAPSGTHHVGGAAAVADRARAGDGQALAVFDRAAAALAEAIGRYVTLLGPQMVVLGGGLGAAADLLTPQVTAGVRQQLTFEREPEVVQAVLGADAGVIGAGLLGWQVVG